MTYTENGTSLSYHKLQFLLIQVHLNILHQLHVFFRKRVLKVAFETDSGSTVISRLTKIIRSESHSLAET